MKQSCYLFVIISSGVFEGSPRTLLGKFFFFPQGYWGKIYRFTLNVVAIQLSDYSYSHKMMNRDKKLGKLFTLFLIYILSSILIFWFYFRLFFY